MAPPPVFLAGVAKGWVARRFLAEVTSEPGYTRANKVSRLSARWISLTSRSSGVNNTLFGPLTQSVEYLPFKQRVVGSNPTRPIKRVPIV